jgi:hypothetical protein
MFKDSVNGRKADFFEFTEKERIVFELLRVFFTRALMLIHFKFDKSIKIKTNISDFIIIGILSQSENGQAINNS